MKLGFYRSAGGSANLQRCTGMTSWQLQTLALDQPDEAREQFLVLKLPRICLLVVGGTSAGKFTSSSSSQMVACPLVVNGVELVSSWF